jgi:LEA14-like dessication related protein
MRALVPIVLLLAAGCSKPAPPTLVPERVQITGLTSSHIDLEVTLDATNPNSIDLVARSLTAHVVIAGKFDVGTAEIPVTTTLPARQTTRIDVPISLKLEDIAPLGKLAITSATLPYRVDGVVSLGGDLLHIEIPYHLTDAIPRSQIAHAVLATIPGLEALH